MDRMQDEWRAWQNVVRELEECGLDVNDPANDALIKSINCWGEFLVDLRINQNKHMRERARTEKLALYLSATDESEEE